MDEFLGERYSAVRHNENQDNQLKRVDDRLCCPQLDGVDDASSAKCRRSRNYRFAGFGFPQWRNLFTMSLLNNTHGGGQRNTLQMSRTVAIMVTFAVFCMGVISGCCLVVWFLNFIGPVQQLLDNPSNVLVRKLNETDGRTFESEPIMSKQIYPGADAHRLHGIVGVDKEGNPGWKPQPLLFRLTDEQKTEAHKGYAFNSRVSDSLSLDRKVPDSNDPRCNERMKEYHNLPTTSIIIVFYNENLSVLLRSVHSVLNRTPPELLKEIILVDDFSDPISHPWLQKQLDDYLLLLPKTRIRRLPHRHGLMMARMAGVEWATGVVAIFLDSHIECAPNWAEPLLARIQEDRRYVAIPIIHTIDFDDFEFKGPGLTILGFSWSLGQRPLQKDVSNFYPTASPVMAGGLFAINISWLLELGGYDKEMRLYGGEEMEISFKIWQCGGRMDLIPCSRVGHVFRSSKFWVGQVYKVPGEEIHRNKLRAAEVWMDEYAKITKWLISPLPSGFEIGDMDEQKATRKKLKCRPFKWFLEEVYPEAITPLIGNNSRMGDIRTKKLNGCVDALTKNQNDIGVYPCHNHHGTQAFFLNAKGEISPLERGFERCLKGDKETGSIKHVPCVDNEESLEWVYDEQTGRVKSGDYCMELVVRSTPLSPYDLVFAKCDLNKELQEFEFPALPLVAFE